MEANALKTTIVDVAREASVSPMTVSRTLHQPEKVAPETRMRVLAACEKLNYRPNASARSLRTNRSHQVGVIIPDWRNPFWIDVVGGIEEVLTDAGYQLLIANSNEESEQQTLQIEVMLSRSVEGLLIAPAVGSAEMIRELQQKGQEIVIIDRLPVGLGKVNCVTIDNEQGAFQATTHLIEQGHQRIGLLAGNINLDTGQQRLNGYRRALQVHNLDEDPELIRTAGTNAALVGKQVGYEGTLEFLGQDNPPTALLCTSNTIAIGALTGLQERQVRIPQEMAVVSFGNMEWTPLLTPPLTVVTQPTTEMGCQAAQMLIEYLRAGRHDGVAHRHLVLEPRLIVRQSSKSL